MTNVDLRLNGKCRRQPEELTQKKNMAVSDVERGMIDAVPEDILSMRRQEAVERLIGLNLEDPPESETISRELEAAHEPGGVC